MPSSKIVGTGCQVSNMNLEGDTKSHIIADIKMRYKAQWYVFILLLKLKMYLPS